MVLWLAIPTPQSLMIGAAISIVSESIRLWARGISKSRGVTQSGPCANAASAVSRLIADWDRDGGGRDNLIVAALVIAYLALTLTAACGTRKRTCAEIR
jgi:hypothetical protein